MDSSPVPLRLAAAFARAQELRLPETAAQHCRNALQILEALQELLLEDDYKFPDATLRTLAGARDRVWQAIWLLEEHR